MLLWLQTTSPQFSRRSSLLILLLLRPCRNSQDGTRRSITWSCHWKTALKTCNAAFPRPFSEVADECCYELLGGGGGWCEMGKQSSWNCEFSDAIHESKSRSALLWWHVTLYHETHLFLRHARGVIWGPKSKHRLSSQAQPVLETS